MMDPSYFLQVNLVRSPPVSMHNVTKPTHTKTEGGGSVCMMY